MEGFNKHLCYNCFQERPEGMAPVPAAGSIFWKISRNTPQRSGPAQCSIAATLWAGSWGRGGFGITYLAPDTQLDKKLPSRSSCPESWPPGRRNHRLRPGREQDGRPSPTVPNGSRRRPGHWPSLSATPILPVFPATLTKTTHPISSWTISRASPSRPTSPTTAARSAWRTPAMS